VIAEKRKLIKWSDTADQQTQSLGNEIEEWVACEINLKININGKELVRFACSPIDCQDLAIGFIYTEGIISRLEDIEYLIFNHTTLTVKFTLSKNIQVDLAEWYNSRTLSSGCGQGVISKVEYRRKNLVPLEFKLTANPKCLAQLFNHLKNHSEWYEKTGCIHQATLFNEGESAIIREDIGRHNAIDKIIGAALQCNLNFENSILNCSGRLSSDMILKAGKAQIPIIVSRAAPTTLAVDIANELGMTLIGFARGKRLNIYTHPERISVDTQNEIEKNMEFLIRK
jgi:FdhD protein